MTSPDTAVRSDFLNAMHSRGYVHQCTDTAGLDAALIDGVVPAYIGFDCTADSLHVGSLVQIMMLRWLQKTGHKPIVLLGGGTNGGGGRRGERRGWRWGGWHRRRGWLRWGRPWW